MVLWQGQCPSATESSSWLQYHMGWWWSLRFQVSTMRAFPSFSYTKGKMECDNCHAQEQVGSSNPLLRPRKLCCPVFPIKLGQGCCLVTQSCPTFHDPNCNMQGLPVPHHPLEFSQVHVHYISNAIQPSHSLTPFSPSALNLSQHQGLFQWVSCSHQVTKMLELQLQHQSFQRVFRHIY